MVKSIILICLIIFPAVVWVTFKPVRIRAPELVTGITCMSDTICLDEVSRYPEAIKLYDEAFDFVVSTVDKIEKNQKLYFVPRKHVLSHSALIRHLLKQWENQVLLLAQRVGHITIFAMK